LRKSAGSKTFPKFSQQILPIPRFSGILVLCLSVLAFIIGDARKEIILTVTAVILALTLVYTFLAVLCLSILHGKSFRTISTSVIPEKIRAGGSASLFINGMNRTSKKYFFIELPAIVIRFTLCLETKDHKKIKLIFPRDIFLCSGESRGSFFTVPLRGVYYGIYDYIIISDLFGFFYFSFKIPSESGGRLFVSPALSQEAIPLTGFSGGVIQQEEKSFVRTDDLLEQRPYIPGDDPRRINWKLYGHLGNLFVREENREPPPHSIFAVLICGEVDGALYSFSPNRDNKESEYRPPSRAAAALDLLCEVVLATTVRYIQEGVSVLCGVNGSVMHGCGLEDITKTLSLPFAFSKKEFANGCLDLPLDCNEKNIVIFALPHLSGGEHAHTNHAIDRFLLKRNITQKVRILFLYHDEKDSGGGDYNWKLAQSAEKCAIQYSRQENVHAQAVKI
jgi:hypothetical protein